MLPMLLAFALQGTLPPPPPRDLFDRLEGEWICRQEMLASGPLWRTEIWWSQEDGSAAGRIMIASRRLASGEARHPDINVFFSRRARGPRLTYQPAGGRPVRYRLARAAPTEAVFQAIGNGSPRIISYRLVSGRLEVMHGMADGSSRRWTYRPAGTRSAAIACDGRQARP